MASKTLASRGGMRRESSRFRACPLCDSQDRTVLFRQRFAELGDDALLTRYDVAVCDACGFAFADAIPEQAAFDVHYRDMSRYEYQQQAGNEPAWVLDRYRATADFVTPLLESTQARILDVGCATGGMLAVLRERGFSNLLGYDPSPGCGEAARRLYDVEVLTRTLSDLRLESRRFELVMLTGVLEHVRDLSSAVAAIRHVVAPGGLVLIGVPDATQFAEWPNAPFQEFSVEHINFFSPRSLENLMGRYGFTQIASQRMKSELSRDAIEPAVHSVFRRTKYSDELMVADLEAEQGLLSYIAKCEAMTADIDRILENVHRSGRSIIVWGVGTHTLRLLASSRMKDLKIAAFVDSNTKYAGKMLEGISVITPGELKGRCEPILISSYVHQEAIATQIRRTMGLRNDLIRLYEIQVSKAA